MKEALLLLGNLFLFLAAVGALRLPDFYLRTAAISKAGSLAFVCFALAAAWHFQSVWVTTKLIFTIVLFLVGTAMAAHLIGRYAFKSKVRLSPHTKIPKDMNSTTDLDG